MPTSTAIASPTSPLLFPCLVCGGGIVTRTSREEFLQFHCAGHAGSNLFLLKFVPGPSGRQAPSWILDRSGGFREVRLIRTRRAWAAGLRWLWDFTLAECEVRPPQNLTAGELIGKLGNLKGRPPFQTAGHLRGFLEKLPPDQVFDERLFGEFWRQFSYPITPEQWHEHYP
jgi:hypothetical protein